MEGCIVEVQVWTTINKTELIILSSLFIRQGIQMTDGAISPGSLSVCNLGIVFDVHLTMGNLAWKVCSTAYCHPTNISSIRKALTLDSAVALVYVFVSCRLDSCNSLLSVISNELLYQLQRVQHILDGVTGTKRYDHVTPLLKILHWLPMEQLVKFKVLPFTFKRLKGAASSYMRHVSTFPKGHQHLRYSSEDILVVLKTTRLKMAGDWTFIYQAATLWNVLPEAIRSMKTVATFKSHVKTYLF